MFLAPVLTVTRASGLGLAFGVAALFIGSCSVLPNESDRLRIERMEEAVLPMARIALEAEQTETAKRLYRRLLEVDPNSVNARMGLGDIAVAGRDSAEAARWYAAAVAHARRADELHPALLAHGRVALAMGELEAARRSFSRLTSEREYAPTLSVAWGLNGLGLVSLLEGDIRSAIKFMEQAVLLAPDEKMLADNLSRALDLSAGMVPEGASVDQMQDMAVAAATASIPDARRPAPADEAVASTASIPDARRPAPADEAAASTASIPDARRPAPANKAAAPVEKEAARDQTREKSIPQAYSTPEAGEHEARPTGGGSGSNLRRIDRSELRPYAIRVGGEYYVRIGAHTLKTEAQNVAAELRRVTAEPVDVVEFGMGDGRNAVRLYRVLVGPIASSAGLVELVATLEEMGYGAARVPPSVDSQSEPAAVAQVERSSEQRSAGPELVEVFLDPESDEADAIPPPPLQAESIPEPASEGENPDATRTAASQTEVEPEPATQRERLEVRSAAEMPSPENVESERTAGATGSIPGDIAIASLSGNGSGNPENAPQFLQVGAYTVRSTAEALAAEVGGVARAPVRVVEAELANGETMYRVQVGPIGSHQALKELSEMLISWGYGTVRVLPESATADSTLGDALPPAPPPPSGSSGRRVKAFIVNEEGERFLQMGAYAVRATADTLASQLRLVASEPAFAAEALNDAGESLYRVRIGPIESDAALATLLRVLRSSYGNGWVLPLMDTDSTRAAFIVHEGLDRFLQMGAYAVRSAAEALVSELRGQIDGEIRITEVSGGEDRRIYRVRVGPIASDDSLLALLEAVESLGYVVD